MQFHNCWGHKVPLAHFRSKKEKLLAPKLLITYYTLYYAMMFLYQIYFIFAIKYDNNILNQNYTFVFRSLFVLFLLEILFIACSVNDIDIFLAIWILENFCLSFILSLLQRKKLYTLYCKNYFKLFLKWW